MGFRRASRTIRTALAASATVGLLATGAISAQGSAATKDKTPAACTRGAKCAVVARVDVDGDARPDTVSVTATRLRGQRAQLLRVVTATGKSAQVQVRTPWLWSGKQAWHGASELDGRPGAELVLATGSGAHTSFFEVYSWVPTAGGRSGRLIAQRDPSSASTQWSIDGALSISKGYRMTRTRGVKTLVATSYEADWTRPKASRMRGKIETFRWVSGSWRAVSTRSVTAASNSPQVARAYGWHAAGLPRD